jgi:hypothetical protein
VTGPAGAPTVTVQRTYSGWWVVVRRGAGTRKFECMTRTGALVKAWRLTR